MKRYIGVKEINAKPMTRQAYNDFRGWTLPADENGDDEGYLVEYVDGGKANTTEYKGYISWSPKDVFERAYKDASITSFVMSKDDVKQAFFAAGLEEDYNFLEEDLMKLASAFGSLRNAEVAERIFRAVKAENERCVTFVRSLNPTVAQALEDKKGPL